MNQGIQDADPEAAMAEASKLITKEIATAHASYRSGLILAAGIEDESQIGAAKADELRTVQQRNDNRLALRPGLKRKLQDLVAIV